VAIIDLQGDRAITHDLDRYTDLYHFDPAINARVVAAACARDARLDPQKLGASEQDLREQVRELQTPAGLAQLLGATTPGAPSAPRR
jgi:hypothetical protein